MLANKIWQCIFLNIEGNLRNGSTSRKSTLMKFAIITDQGKIYIYICITILIDAEKVFYKIQHSLIKKQANQNLNIGYLLTEISHVMVKHQNNSHLSETIQGSQLSSLVFNIMLKVLVILIIEDKKEKKIGEGRNGQSMPHLQTILEPFQKFQTRRFGNMTRHEINI